MKIMIKYYGNNDKPYQCRDIIPIKLLKKDKGNKLGISLTFSGVSKMNLTDEFVKQISNVIISKFEERKDD